MIKLPLSIFSGIKLRGISAGFTDVDGCQNPPISGCEAQLTIPRIIFPK
jgi:hypothetical protein